MTRSEFSWIFRSPDELRSTAETALSSKRRALDAVIAVPAGERTFRNTIAALEYADDPLADIQQQMDLLVSVHPDASVRSAAQSVADRIDEENVSMEFDRRLWQAVQEWSQLGEKLDAVDRKLADDTIRDMKRMGFDLSDGNFTTLKTNTVELRKLQTEFEKAINDWEDHILLCRNELSGMPDSYIDSLARDGSRYRVSLEYPDYFPFMRLADNEKARMELSTKNLLKGGRDNLERLARMVRLRESNARLLGYATHADFVSETRMAKTSDAIGSFIARILKGLMPEAKSERAGLADLKKRTLRAQDPVKIQYHEMSYWGYKQYRELYDIDPEVIKEYFPLEHVIGEMLLLYAQVLGVAFNRVPDAVLWHPDVSLFEVRVSGSLIGHFALDLYPRKGKYGHAAAFPVVLGRMSQEGEQIPGFVALVCNFPKPTPARASLLTHDEVETLLHEFGHVCHALLSGGRWQSQNGFAVPQDFVEALSQLFEEWAWDPSVIRRLSKHQSTGLQMPSALMTTMIAARHHLDATMYLQQAIQALCDFRIHSRLAGSAIEAQELSGAYRDLRQEYESVDIPEQSLFPAGWSHMADYDAGYYGYLWSKVYALDMYTRFEPDPLSTKVGAQYRRIILEPGSSKPELELVREFLSREPSDAPFLAALGITRDRQHG